jgi:hypothetical protein
MCLVFDFRFWVWVGLGFILFGVRLPLVGCLPLVLGLSFDRVTLVGDAWVGVASSSWLVSEYY